MIKSNLNPTKYPIPPTRALRIEYDKDTDTLILWNGAPASNGSTIASNLVVFSDDDDEVNIVTLEKAADLLRPYLFPEVSS